MTVQVEISQAELAALCQRHRIRKLALFGSVLRDDFGPESDVDVLVEFEPGERVTLLDMGAAQMELSELFGRNVDLKTAAFLSPYFRNEVLETAQTLYERACGDGLR